MNHIAVIAALALVAATPPVPAALWAGAGGPGARGSGVRAPDGEVKAVSVLPGAGKVEVIIDLQGAVEVLDFTLAGPARLVIDLMGARLTAPAVLYDGQNRGGIRNIRYAQFRPDIVRVVIDLDALKDYKVERKDGQVRVELGTDRRGFAAWSSRTVATVAAAPPPALAAPRLERPAVSGGPEAAGRVSVPRSGRSVSIAEYLAAHATEAAQSQAPRITVQWDGASVEEVIAGFAAFSGRTIVLGKGVSGNLSAEIKNQPWDLAFYAVLESQTLGHQVLPGGIIHVLNKADMARSDSTVPLETRLVRINYAKAISLQPAVASIVSKPRGVVVADSSTNSLVITEVSTRINDVESFVRGLDIRTPQVSIQA
ncbi:MAG TPA: AMIN domain-containing protein, partial [Gemmatimonadales bacterium]